MKPLFFSHSPILAHDSQLLLSSTQEDDVAMKKINKEDSFLRKMLEN